ncbi:MAG: hypothetical protein DBY41_02015 [Clostridium sp.]|nr:MAG: hypothetical protein DBY41_02015 [Clostridium sp.]
MVIIVIHSIQKWLPFEKILENGIIKLKNNSYIMILKIKPINYNLKSNLEKESILNSYKLFLKTFNFNIQIIIKSQKQDLSNHIIKIINSQKKESQIIKNISNKYLENIEKIKLISKSDSKQFFIIINQPQENNKEEICIDQLNEKYLKIKEGLLRCGNIVTNVNKEKETKEIIRNYIFLNDDENRM